MEAMQNATQPAWVPFTFPILGAVGVLIGGKLRRSAWIKRGLLTEIKKGES